MKANRSQDIISNLLKAIADYQPITFTKLAKLTELSVWTVSDIIKILENENKVSVEPFARAKLVRIKNAK